MQNTTKIAFIGTGIMGGHMARRLAQAGYKVSAWNRTPASAFPNFPRDLSLWLF